MTTLRKIEISVRNDGTFEAIKRWDDLLFAAANGVEMVQRVDSFVAPEEWGALLGAQAEAYGAYDAHNKAVEAANVAKDARIAELEAAVALRDGRIAELEGATQ